MIEKIVGAKFAASTDATGNMAHGGNWELELGNRNVAPIYFDENKLTEFETLMKCNKRVSSLKASDKQMQRSSDWTKHDPNAKVKETERVDYVHGSKRKSKIKKIKE